MPPLRERKEEIPILIRHFMRKLSASFARQPLIMSDELLAAYMQYDWPGNLRELESSIKRYLVLGSEQHMLGELRRAMGGHLGRKPGMAEPDGAPIGLKKRARSAMNHFDAGKAGGFAPRR